MGRRRKPYPAQPDPGDNALDCVTTRLGWLVVDQTDGDYPPFAVIQSSRTQPRQPHGTNELSLLSRELDPANFRPTIYPNRPGEKWCPDCGDWRPLSYFADCPRNKDGQPVRRDGKRAYCREHERQRNRGYKRKDEQKA